MRPARLPALWSVDHNHAKIRWKIRRADWPARVREDIWRRCIGTEYSEETDDGPPMGPGPGAGRASEGDGEVDGEEELEVEVEEDGELEVAVEGDGCYVEVEDDGDAVEVEVDGENVTVQRDGDQDEDEDDDAEDDGEDVVVVVEGADEKGRNDKRMANGCQGDAGRSDV